jgi:predicted SnoaL-like aldol condensation-catalyzing enzyme
MASNGDLVREAMTAFFINRDPNALEKYWAPDYKQHNPTMPDGTAALAPALDMLPPDFTYEIGNIAAEGDLVFLHGRYTNMGPTPTIAVDIFRVQDGKIVEHWDVLQPEEQKTASGRPMFEAR